MRSMCGVGAIKVRCGRGPLRYDQGALRSRYDTRVVWYGTCDVWYAKVRPIDVRQINKF